MLHSLFISRDTIFSLLSLLFFGHLIENVVWSCISLHASLHLSLDLIPELNNKIQEHLNAEQARPLT